MKNIPKICHLYWNGRPMPRLSVYTVESFHRYNPDWEIVIYVSDFNDKIDSSDQNPKYRMYTGEDYFPLLKKLDYVRWEKVTPAKEGISTILFSDIFRREILYSMGGVYSDFDMLWLRPISELVNVDCLGDPTDFESTVCFYNLTTGFHNVSNIVSEKRSEFLRRLIDCSEGVGSPWGDQSFGTDLLNSVFPNWESVVSKYPRMLGLRYETFYPYSTFNQRQLFVENDLSPLKSKNVLGIHWFSGNEYSKEYVNGKGFDTDCSMTTILKNEGWI